MGVFKLNIKHILTLKLFLFVVFIALSQNDFDSKLKTASLEIYDNPKKSIEIGQYIFETTSSTVEQKAEALILISTAYSSLRSYELSFEYANKALNLLPNIKSKKFKIKILNKLGAQYQQLKVYDKALEILDESAAIFSKKENLDSISNLVGFNYAVRGFIYREQMSCEIALQFFNRSLYYFQNYLDKDPIMNANISIINYNKGNCFISISKIDSAKVSFDKAFFYADVIDAKSLLGFAQKGKAEVFTLQGNYKEATSILENAIILSSEVGDLILNMGIYRGLSDNFLALDDNKNHLIYKEKFEKLSTQLKQTENSAINTSLSKIITENDKELSKLQTLTSGLKIAQYFILIIFMIPITLELILYFKKSKMLKETKKTLSKKMF